MFWTRSGSFGEITHFYKQNELNFRFLKTESQKIADRTICQAEKNGVVFSRRKGKAPCKFLQRLLKECLGDPFGSDTLPETSIAPDGGPDSNGWRFYTTN